MYVTGTVNWKRQFKWQAQCTKCHKRRQKGDRSFPRMIFLLNTMNSVAQLTRVLLFMALVFNWSKREKKKAIKQGEKKKLA